MPALTRSAEVKGGGEGFSLSRFRACSRQAAKRIWRGIREWCGDSAYEIYLRSKARESSATRPLSRAEFYVEQLDRRYSRPNRCC